MKKLSSLILLCFISTAGAFWGANNWENQADIQVSTTNSPAIITNPAPVFIDNPGRGLRDCFTKVSFSGDLFPAAGATLRFISASSMTIQNQSIAGGTTFYSMAWTTGTVIDYWDFQNPLCNPDVGTTTYITVSTGNYKVNVNGFIRNR